MPITLTHYQAGDLCWGYSWAIDNEELLVELVAKVLIGREHHVAKILTGVPGRKIQFDQNVIHDAIKKLTVSGDEDPWHRDGLVFQVFSWIAANVGAGTHSIIRSPHLISAHKGFDGLQIEIDETTSSVQAVVIFEDKATTSPRDTIREKVWPEFESLNNGERESELMQEVTSLLTTRSDLVDDVEQAIEKLIWNKVRSYRVSITASQGHMSNVGKSGLFKGYNKCVPGEQLDQRRAELIHIPHLRSWMNNFCGKVIKYLNQQADTDV